MKTFSKKRWNQISLSLTILTGVGIATAQSALAATFTVAGYTWDSDNSVVGGSIVSGSQVINHFTASFLSGNSEIANRTVGAILGFDPDSSVNIGDVNNPAIPGTIDLNWGTGMSLTNAAGNDFVVYENGGWGRPEAYAVAIKKVGQSSFTQFRYEFSDGFETNVFATGFDLSDFGIGNEEAIDGIRITKLIPTDTVSGSDGQGFLGGSFNPQTGPWGGGSYTNDMFDPDATFVVALHKPKPVPEPTSALALLTFGAVTAAALQRKHQSKVKG
ncbi:hypothetical protein [Aerosakkonema funiforme]|uniref:hypothetical protein n=1 Tax=Aerosakkonema funiforme TaxID=1246630 RepID=UPI0035B9C7F8